MNTYAYVDSNPLIYVDPDGLFIRRLLTGRFGLYRFVKEPGRTLKDASRQFNKWKNDKGKKYWDNTKNYVVDKYMRFGLCMNECMRNNNVENACKGWPDYLGGEDFASYSYCSTYCAIKVGLDKYP